MKNIIYVFTLLFIVVACKTEKKEQNEDNVSKEINVEKELSFEGNLLDLREIDEEFIEDYKVEKFGIQQVNDSVFGFVFKLNDNTLSEVVKSYSIGIKGFNTDVENQFGSSFSPDIEEIEGNKYIIMKRNMKENKYFDSIRVIIYQRNNWKASGTLGQFFVRDIVFNNYE